MSDEIDPTLRSLAGLVAEARGVSVGEYLDSVLAPIIGEHVRAETDFGKQAVARSRAQAGLVRPVTLKTY